MKHSKRMNSLGQLSEVVEKVLKLLSPFLRFCLMEKDIQLNLRSHNNDGSGTIQHSLCYG